MEDLGLLVDLFLPGFLVPAAVAAGILLGAGWIIGTASERAGRVAGAAALSAGFCAAWVVLPAARWWPEDPWDWLPYLTVLAGGAGLIDLVPAVPRLLVWLVRLAVAAVAAWLLVPVLGELAKLRSGWLAGTAATVCLLWFLLEPLAGRLPPGRLPALLGLVAGAAAVVLEAAGILKLAQAAGVLTAGLAACALASWGRTSSFLRGMIPGLAVVLPGLLLNGYVYRTTTVPAVAFLLLLAAPLGPWVGALPLLRDMTGWRRTVVQAAAVLLPAGLAVGIALLSSGEW
jgi:hypothetical protein